MSEWTCADGLKWRPLEPFGGEIDDDLAVPVEGARRKSFYALLREHGLILARGQALTMEQQTALMTPIGPIIRRPQENGYISTDPNAPSSRTGPAFHPAPPSP